MTTTIPIMTFSECLRERRAWYKALKPIEIPILNENVVFNSKGFYHLKHDGTGRARTIRAYHNKLHLLPMIIPVIEKAKNIYDYKPKVYSKVLGKYFELWELREEINLPEVTGTENYLVSAVVRRIGKNGNIQFYSVWGKKLKQKSGQK